MIKHLKPSDVLFTPKEVAEFLKVTPATVYNWHKTGRLKGHVFSRGKRKSTVRFDMDQINAMIPGYRHK